MIRSTVRAAFGVTLTPPEDRAPGERYDWRVSFTLDLDGIRQSCVDYVWADTEAQAIALVLDVWPRARIHRVVQLDDRGLPTRNPFLPERAS